MSKYIIAGSHVSVIPSDSAEVTNDLPAGFYIIQEEKPKGSEKYYLQRVGGFSVPKKMYGDFIKRSSRVLHTFHSRPNSTGILLSGMKGSGKTLLSKTIGVEAVESGLPVILVNQPWGGDAFNAFIQAIETPTVMIFDEFEKVYGYSDQEKLLTLLDGVYPSKNLFVLTANETGHNVSNYMLNRPGRIYYHFKYDGIEPEVVEQYLDENLDDLTQKESILKYSKTFSMFNFDMMVAAVEEMNRYEETFHQALDYINVSPENKKTDKFSYMLEITEDQNGVSCFVEPSDDNFDYKDDQWLELRPKDKKLFEEAGMGGALKAITDKINQGNIYAGPDEMVFSCDDLTEFDPENSSYVYEIHSGGAKATLLVSRKENRDLGMKNFF